MGTWHEYLKTQGTPPEWPYPIKFGEENVQQYRAHDGAQGCTCTQGYRLAQDHTQIAHAETECQSAYTP